MLAWIGFVVAFATGGITPNVANYGKPYWRPDEGTLRSIESTMTLPELKPWEPGPLESYSRYYFGWTENGRHVIVGHLMRGRMTHDAPGIYVVDFGDIRTSSTGGGCDHIVLHYDIEAHKTTNLVCYGLG